MNAYLTRHRATIARLRNQRRDLLERAASWLDARLDPQAWSLPHEPRDPHDVESRKWFRRALISLCVTGYALLLLGPPDWLRPKPERASLPPLTVVDERCATVQIIGFRIPGSNLRVKKPLTWWDCTKTFSDGTTFRRIGDLKP